MGKILIEKFKEGILSVLPMTIIISIIGLIIGLPAKDFVTFGLSALFLSVGLTLFTLGSYSSMLLIAEKIGTHVTKNRRLWTLIIITFIVGFMITVAEPALWVLGGQFKLTPLVPQIPELTLVLPVALGVGLFLVLAILRVVFQIKLRTLIFIFYPLLFIFAAFISPEFIPVSFDSGGVTTGPMAVPFIIAFGMGVASSRGELSADDDSFGLVGISSIGPILSVLILGLFLKPGYSGEYEVVSLSLLGHLFNSLINVSLMIIPFILFFAIFQIKVFHLKKRAVIKVLVAFLYVYLGLVLFLTGANAGFVSMGAAIGEFFASSAYTWILIPLGMVFGFVVISAEPSVIVLNRQVEDMTGGAISRKIMGITMSIGISISIGLAMLRVITGISIWWILIPGYAIALALTFFSPKIFTAIAFDSGGAVSGAMTSTFLVTFALGASSAIPNSNMLTDAFGLVAFVAMTPLIAIQILGLIYKVKNTTKPKEYIEEEILDLKRGAQ